MTNMSANTLGIVLCVVVCALAGSTHGTDNADQQETMLLTVVVQRVSLLEARVDTCQTELQELRKHQQRQQPVIVFSVEHSGMHFTGDYHVTIVFDVILMNAGGGYSASNGWFTAPLSGLYFVTFRGWGKPGPRRASCS
ncbi:uncharacterized protein LOC143301484 [Babylonia areolata]|uniref:uncharacterized protein LOC143301484 n=1 Tax=Babylonia areolata TaxID=304850 RepID=UPI003FD59F46